MKHYTAADGLVSSSHWGVAFRDRHGALWFGTLQGVSRLVPEADEPAFPPSIRISGIHVRGEPYPVSELGETRLAHLILEPNQNHVEIDFASFNFGVGEVLRYQYKLEGADRDWSPVTEQRTVNYATLSPGTYRFLVRAINWKGLLSSQPAEVEFQVLPPVWRRWWVLILEATALVTALYAAHRYRTQQLLAVERVRMRIATDLHDDVGAGLSQIAILSEVARLGAFGGSAREQALGRIGSIARELVDSMSDIVWSISPRKDRLHDLTGRMREVAGDLLIPRNIRFELVPQGANDNIKLSPELRRHVFLIFKESIRNVARHSGSTEARIEFGIEDKRLVLRVSDNGCGLDDGRSGQGHGFEGMRERARLLGGQIDLVSSPGTGLPVTLHVRLR